MERFLILKIDGVLQAWGAHTFEDYRLSHAFPTLSGLLGLLGACLGIERDDAGARQALADSVEFAVRADRKRIPGAGDGDSLQLVPSTRLSDFHTIEKARKVGGKVNEYPVVSRREYLCDAPFTIAIGQRPEAAYSLERIADAVRKPVYTPSLGRRSCPPTRPLFECFVEAASDIVDALHKVEPQGGVIYAESPDTTLPQQRIRDRPIISRPRQFSSRRVSIHASEEGSA